MRSLKIIWNITNKCGYSCEVCATYSNRNELDIEGKTNALKSILSVGGRISKKLIFLVVIHYTRLIRFRLFMML